jgi:protoheme IX farnesyltransferase
MTKNSNSNKFQAYLSLTKPGIIRGNLMAAIAGFLLASQQHHIDIQLLIWLLVGMTLVIGAGCTINNSQDKEIDKEMARTKNRAIVQGLISQDAALKFAVILAIAGFAILIIYTNWLTVLAGLIGFVDYVVFYRTAKRQSSNGTLIGAISGAMPPVAGYVAVTKSLDMATVVIFLMMVAWQMAHFLSIAIYRYNDYKNAGLPVMPVEKGMLETKHQIRRSILAFILSAELLSFFGYTGIFYIFIVGFIGFYWLNLYFKEDQMNDQDWGKKMFLFSLVAISTVFLMMSINTLLP